MLCLNSVTEWLRDLTNGEPILYDKILCFIIYKHWFLASGNIQGQETFLTFKISGWGCPGLEGITYGYYSVGGPTLRWENLVAANTTKVKDAKHKN
jgi:hypothetical protein